MQEGKVRSRPITADLIDQARESLILRRVTHLDQLVDKLGEKRVRHVIEPIVVGGQLPSNIPEDDISYAIDLSLIRNGEDGIEIANPIYKEVIPRQLSAQAQNSLEGMYRPDRFRLPDGRLDMDGMLEAFQDFYRENSEVWAESFEYHEAWPHLLLMAFLQRVINHGGRIYREYAVGRGRMDLLVAWPGYWQKGGQEMERQNASDVSTASCPLPSAGAQRFVIEVKILRDSPERTLALALQHTAGYMDHCRATEGHLVLIDRRAGQTWDERIYRRQERAADKAITVWGM
jgi:hypothetical protein